ncbi:hypothetical protein Pelo_556 [Pelomyxa schiedti]|nr:hypothetical protein Pelo_556 [Pelomyxa schiedti]
MSASPSRTGDTPSPPTSAAADVLPHSSDDDDAELVAITGGGGGGTRRGNDSSGRGTEEAGGGAGGGDGDGEGEGGMDEEGKAEIAQKIFERCDVNHLGALDAAELVDALAMLGRKASLEEAEELITKLDRDNDGLINLQEFVDSFAELFHNWVPPDDDTPQSNDVPNPLATSKSESDGNLSEQSVSPEIDEVPVSNPSDGIIPSFPELSEHDERMMTDLFGKIDVDADGLISREDMRKFFKVGPFSSFLSIEAIDKVQNISDERLEAVFQSVDSNGDDVITLNEFLCGIHELSDLLEQVDSISAHRTKKEEEAPTEIEAESSDSDVPSQGPISSFKSIDSIESLQTTEDILQDYQNATQHDMELLQAEKSNLERKIEEKEVELQHLHLEIAEYQKMIKAHGEAQNEVQQLKAELNSQSQHYRELQKDLNSLLEKEKIMQRAEDNLLSETSQLKEQLASSISSQKTLEGQLQSVIAEKSRLERNLKEAEKALKAAEMLKQEYERLAEEKESHLDVQPDYSELVESVVPRHDDCTTTTVVKSTDKEPEEKEVPLYVENLEMDLANAQKRGVELESECADLRSQLESQKTQLQETTKKFDSCVTQKSELEVNLASLESQIAGCKSTISMLQEKLSEQERATCNTQSSLETCQQKLLESESKLDSERSTTDTLRKTLDSKVLEMQALESEKQTLQSQCADLKLQIESVTHDYEKLTAEHQAAEQEWKKRLDLLTTELDHEKEVVAFLGDKTVKQTSHASEMEAEIAQLKQRVSIFQENITELELERAKLEEFINQQKRIILSLEGKISSCKETEEQLQQKLKQLSSELESTSATLTKTIEEKDQAKKIVSELTVEVDGLKVRQNAVEGKCLEQKQELEAKESEIASHLETERRYITEAGELQKSISNITSTMHQQEEAAQSKIEALQSCITDLQNQHTKAEKLTEEKVSQLQSEINANLTNITQQTAKNTELQVTVDSLNHRISQLQNDLLLSGQDASVRLADLNKTIFDMNSEHTLAKKALQEQLDLLTRQQQSDSAVILQHQQSEKQLLHKIEELEQDAAQLKLTIQTQKDNAEQQVAALNLITQQLQEQYTAHKKETEEKFSSMREQIAQDSKIIAMSHDSELKYQENIDKLQRSISDLERTIVSQREHADKLQEQLDSANNFLVLERAKEQQNKEEMEKVGKTLELLQSDLQTQKTLNDDLTDKLNASNALAVKLQESESKWLSVVTGLEEKLQTLQTSVAAEMETNSGLQKQLQNSEAAIATHKDNECTYVATIATLETTIKHLQQDLVGQKKISDLLQEKLDSDSKTIESYVSSEKQYLSQIAGLDQTVRNLREEIESGQNAKHSLEAHTDEILECHRKDQLEYKKEVDQLSSSVQALQSELVASKGNVDSLQRQLETSQLQVSTHQELERQYKTSISDMENTVKQLQAEVAHWQIEATSLQEQIKQHKVLLNQCQQAENRYRETISLMQSTINSLRDDLTAVTLEKGSSEIHLKEEIVAAKRLHDAAIEHYEEKVKTVEGEYQLTLKQLQDTVAKAHGDTSVHEALKHKLTVCEEELVRQCAAENEYKQILERLSSELEHMKLSEEQQKGNLNSLKDALELKETTLNKLLETHQESIRHIETLEKEVLALHSEKTSLLESSQALQLRFDDHSQIIETSNKSLMGFQDAIKALQGVIAHLQCTTDKQSLEASFFQKQLNNDNEVIAAHCEAEKQYKFNIQRLETTISQLQGEMEVEHAGTEKQLLSLGNKIQELEQQITLERSHHTGELDTLQGQLSTANEALETVQGTHKIALDAIATQDTKEAAHVSTIKQLEAHVTTLCGELEENKSTVQQLHQQIDVLTTSISEHNKKEEEYKETVDKTQATIQQLQDDLKAREGAAASLQELLHRAEEELSNLGRQSKQYMESILQLRNQLESEKENSQKENQKLSEKLIEAISSHKTVVSSYEQQVLHLTGDINRLQTELTSQCEQSATIENLLKAKEIVISSHAQAQKSYEVDLDNMRATVTSLTAQLEVHRSQSTALQAKVTEQEEHARDLEAKLQLAHEKISSQESNHNIITESMGTTVSQLQATLHQQKENEVELQHKIDTLQAELTFKQVATQSELQRMQQSVAELQATCNEEKKISESQIMNLTIKLKESEEASAKYLEAQRQQLHQMEALQTQGKSRETDILEQSKANESLISNLQQQLQTREQEVSFNCNLASQYLEKIRTMEAELEAVRSETRNQYELSSSEIALLQGKLSQLELEKKELSQQHIQQVDQLLADFKEKREASEENHRLAMEEQFQITKALELKLSQLDENAQMSNSRSQAELTALKSGIDNLTRQAASSQQQHKTLVNGLQHKLDYTEKSLGMLQESEKQYQRTIFSLQRAQVQLQKLLQEQMQEAHNTVSSVLMELMKKDEEVHKMREAMISSESQQLQLQSQVTEMTLSLATCEQKLSQVDVRLLQEKPVSTEHIAQHVEHLTEFQEELEKKQQELHKALELASSLRGELESEKQAVHILEQHLESQRAQNRLLEEHLRSATAELMVLESEQNVTKSSPSDKSNECTHETEIQNLHTELGRHQHKILKKDRTIQQLSHDVKAYLMELDVIKKPNTHLSIPMEKWHDIQRRATSIAQQFPATSSHLSSKKWGTPEGTELFLADLEKLLCHPTGNTNTRSEIALQSTKSENMQARLSTLEQLLKHEQQGRQTALHFVKILKEELAQLQQQLLSTISECENLTSHLHNARVAERAASSQVESMRKQSLVHNQLLQECNQHRERLALWLGQEQRWETEHKRLLEILEAEREAHALTREGLRALQEKLIENAEQVNTSTLTHAAKLKKAQDRINELEQISKQLKKQCDLAMARLSDNEKLFSKFIQRDQERKTHSNSFISEFLFLHERSASKLATRLISEEERYIDLVNCFLKNDPELTKYLPVCMVHADVATALADGVLVLKLLNSLFPSCLLEKSICKKPISKQDVSDNYNLATTTALYLGFSINPIQSCLFNGDVPITVRQIAEIIKVGLLSKISLSSTPQLAVLIERTETLSHLAVLNAEQLLLRWVNYHLKRQGTKLSARNFASDFSDGIKYSILLSQITRKTQFVKEVAAINSRDSSKRINNVLQCIALITGTTILTPDLMAAGLAPLNLITLAMLFVACHGLETTLSDETNILINFLAETAQERILKNWVHSFSYPINHLIELTDGVILLHIMDKLHPGVVDSKFLKSYEASLSKNVLNSARWDHIIFLLPQFNCDVPNIKGSMFSSVTKQSREAIVRVATKLVLFQMLQELSKHGMPITEEVVFSWVLHCVSSIGQPSSLSSFNAPGTLSLMCHLMHSIDHRTLSDPDLLPAFSPPASLPFPACCCIGREWQASASQSASVGVKGSGSQSHPITQHPQVVARTTSTGSSQSSSSSSSSSTDISTTSSSSSGSEIPRVPVKPPPSSTIFTKLPTITFSQQHPPPSASTASSATTPASSTTIPATPTTTTTTTTASSSTTTTSSTSTTPSAFGITATTSAPPGNMTKAMTLLCAARRLGCTIYITPEDLASEVPDSTLMFSAALMATTFRR